MVQMTSLPAFGASDPPRIQTSLQDGIPVVAVDGDLLYQHNDLLARALSAFNLDQSPVLDLTACRFVDSTTVGFVVKLHKALEQRGQRLTLVVPPGVVRRSLEISRLDRLLHLVPDLDTAMQGRTPPLP